MQELMPGAEKGAKFAQVFKEIMKKYQDDLVLLTTESFLHEVDLLAEKYHNDKALPDFAKEYYALRLKHAPNLVNFDKEVQSAQCL
jgi:hypothetical protein